jgi:FhuF 2Fe-2S C-terminal domain
VTRAEVLAELARLGPFFALDCHPVGAGLAEGWRPLDELFQQPDVLAARVAVVRGALAEASRQSAGSVELRVAASMAQLGLAARLICPALGVAVLTGGLLEVDPARMRWQPGGGGAVGLSIRADALPAASRPAFDPSAEPGQLATAGPARLADALAGMVLDGPVRTLVEASGAFGVSPQVGWGNVASVVNGAKALIGAAEPGLTTAADALVTGLLNQPPLRGTHQLGTHQVSTAPAFRRRSCCLVYRLAASPGPVCGDCVLDRAPVPASRRSVRRQG